MRSLATAALFDIGLPLLRRSRLFLVLLVALGSPALAQDGAASRENLKRLVSDLQNTPDDQGLREQIIKLALSLNPRPAIPEDARRHFIKAVTIQKEAKSPEDAELAAKEYQAALLLAPWWGDAYFNLALAAQAASRFDEGISALKLYLLTEPSPADARAGQDRIYAIEAKKELAAKSENDKRQEEERALRESEARNRETLQRLVGQWRTMLPLASGRHLLSECDYYNFETRGNEIVATNIHTPYNDPQNCGRQRRPMAHLSITVEGERIIARILPPLLGAGAILTGTLDFNEFKVYGPDNMRWELYREGTYPVRRPGEY
jgi:tetratricopeptide (TPR) repeat protein